MAAASWFDVEGADRRVVEEPVMVVWLMTRCLVFLLQGLGRVLFTVGCGILGGGGVVMVLLPGPVSPRLRTF